MLISIHAQPGTANASAFVLHRPGIGARLSRFIGCGQVLSGVITAAIPLAPPRRAVAVLFFWVDGMAQPVIDIRVPPLAHDDTLTAPGSAAPAASAGPASHPDTTHATWRHNPPRRLRGDVMAWAAGDPWVQLMGARLLAHGMVLQSCQACQ